MVQSSLCSPTITGNLKTRELRSSNYRDKCNPPPKRNQQADHKAELRQFTHTLNEKPRDITAKDKEELKKLVNSESNLQPLSPKKNLKKTRDIGRALWHGGCSNPEQREHVQQSLDGLHKLRKEAKKCSPTVQKVFDDTTQTARSVHRKKIKEPRTANKRSQCKRVKR